MKTTTPVHTEARLVYRWVLYPFGWYSGYKIVKQQRVAWFWIDTQILISSPEDEWYGFAKN